MSRPSLQAVIHACLADPDDAGLNPRQRQVCHHLLDCRTAALGGFCLECDQCQDRAFLTTPVATAIARAANVGPPRTGASASAPRSCR